MKPIKPKKMPKNLERWVSETAGSSSPGLQFTLNRQRARSILAALEYERQRWQESQEKLADRNLGLMALARKYGWSDVDKEIENARWPQSAVDLIAEDAKSEMQSAVGKAISRVHFGNESLPNGAGYTFKRMTEDEKKAWREEVIPKPRKKLTAP